VVELGETTGNSITLGGSGNFDQKDGKKEKDSDQAIHLKRRLVRNPVASDSEGEIEGVRLSLSLERRGGWIVNSSK